MNKIILIFLILLFILYLGFFCKYELFSAWNRNPTSEILRANKYYNTRTLTSDYRPNLLFPDNKNINIRWKIDLCERWKGHENETHNQMINYLNNLKENDIIIDAGSHVGDTGLFLALELKKIGKKCKIYEIDPDKSKLDFIDNIAKFNKLDNIFTINCGLDSKIGKGSQDKTTHAGGWTVIKNGDNQFNLYPLDYLIKKNQRVGLIHFDLEGMEYESLKGSINTIYRDKPAIMMEIIHGNHNKAQKFIENIGYKTIWKGENNTFNLY